MIRIIILFISILPFLTDGQTFSNEILNKNIEFSMSVLITPKLNIERTYLNQKSDINSNKSPSFQASLHLHKKLTGNTSYKIGILTGIYSMTKEISLSEDFNNLGWGDFQSKQTDFSFPYFGINFGINQMILLKKKNFWTISLSLNLIYFRNGEFTFLNYAIPDTKQKKLLFATTFDINNKKKLIYIPQFQISNFRKINNLFSIKTSLVLAYSNSEIFDAEYTLFGDTEMLKGRIAKKFKHIGIEFGILYNLKK
jgi:hypothetical protein